MAGSFSFYATPCSVRRVVVMPRKLKLYTAKAMSKNADQLARKATIAAERARKLRFSGEPHKRKARGPCGLPTRTTGSALARQRASEAAESTRTRPRAERVPRVPPLALLPKVNISKSPARAPSQ